MMTWKPDAQAKEHRGITFACASGFDVPLCHEISPRRESSKLTADDTESPNDSTTIEVHRASRSAVSIVILPSITTTDARHTTRLFRMIGITVNTALIRMNDTTGHHDPFAPNSCWRALSQHVPPAAVPLAVPVVVVVANVAMARRLRVVPSVTK